MDDLDEVSGALGYQCINLWGGSYGTRAALVYLRQHAEHVCSLILAGSAPSTLKVPVLAARDAQRALDLLLAECHEDADCRRAFPETRAQFERLLTRLADSAALASFEHLRTGAPGQLLIERAGLVGAVRKSALRAGARDSALRVERLLIGYA